MTLRHEDGDDEAQLPPSVRKERRRASVGGTNEKRGLERRRSRRHSLQNGRGHASAPASPSSPHTHASTFLPCGSQRVEDISERWGKASKGREKVEICNRKRKALSVPPLQLGLVLILFVKGSSRGQGCFDLVYSKAWEIAASEKGSQIISGSTKYYFCSLEAALLKVSIIFRSWRDASTLSRAKAENLII